MSRPARKMPLVISGASEATTARAKRHERDDPPPCPHRGHRASARRPPGAVQIVLDEATLALPLAGIIDVAAESKRLKREIDKVGSEIRQLDESSANEKFVAVRLSMWSRSSGNVKPMLRQPPQGLSRP